MEGAGPVPYNSRVETVCVGGFVDTCWDCCFVYGSMGL